MPYARQLLILCVVFALAAVPAFAAPNRWTPFGPTGGAVDDVVIDPQSPQRLWMASGGAVYVSVDGGTSWSTTGSGLEGQPVLFLAIDPGQPDILYAASVPSPAHNAPGIFRSQDAGAHWALVASGPDFQSLWSLAVAPWSPGPPGTPGVVFVGTDKKLQRSLDGGATFQPVISLTTSELFIAVVPDPQHPGTVYAANLDQRSKSTDFGTTWTALDEIPGHHPPFVRDLALAPSDPQMLYETGRGTGVGATWRSRNGGATWDGPFPFLGDVLAVDPVDPFTVYGGNFLGLFVSHDGGVTWTQATAGVPPLSIDDTAFYGVRAFATVPGRAGFMLAATAKGLLETDDAGAHWHSLALHGVFTNPIDGFRIDPFNPAHWVLSSLGSWLVSRDGGFTFAPLPAAFHPLRIDAIEFDPFVRNRLWAVVLGSNAAGSNERQLFLSKDGGATWGRIPGTIPDGPALLVPAPGTLLIAGSGISRSTDGGHTWVKAQSGVIGNPDSENAYFLVFQRLQRDPRTARTVYALGQADQPHNSGFFAIYRSDDAGRTWRLWNRGGQSIGFDPFHPHAIHITQFAKMLVTNDNGAHFRVVGDLGLKGYPWVLDLAFDRRHAGVIYAATYGDGVRRSRDGGATWEDAAPGLPAGPLAGPVTTIVQDPARSQRFYATPAGGGLWRADFAQ
jgi:photosystem II stability/assembly factor-like uncharacterized protein